MRDLRGRRAGAIALAAVLFGAGAIQPATAQPADASVAIETINGRAVQDGKVNQPVLGMSFAATGRAEIPVPALVADAGDSSYVREGSPAQVFGLASYGTAPHTFRWSFEGSSQRFAEPTEPATSFDTSDLETGPHTLELTVTDADGRTAQDTVKIFVYRERARTLLQVSEDAELSAGVIEELPAESWEFPFTVPQDTFALELVLDWTKSNTYVVVRTRAFDLYVRDPSGEHDGNEDGATFEKPERIRIDDPAAGDWDAIVESTLNEADTFTLVVTSQDRAPDPTPHISTPGPFTFELGSSQNLSATVTGGTEPYEVSWDLDLDGIFETPGLEVSTAFPLGQHLVTVKVTDAEGYEKRETTVVRVIEPGTTIEAPPFAVIAVVDSGINPYHREFSAATYPDPEVLALTDNFTRHPSEYIPGFPADTASLPVTLGQGYLPPQDQALWTRANIPLNKPFWIPGTKIIAAVDAGDGGFGIPDPRPILDDHGHGTGAASVAVGNTLGFCPRCLLVFIEDPRPRWAYEQPWIDIVSHSYGQGILGLAVPGTAGLIFSTDAQARIAADRGQMALFAAGNGVENGFIIPHDTITTEDKGPDWMIRVGAIQRESRKAIVGTGKPVDMASFGHGVIPAANHTSATGGTNFGGTSAATPYTAGVFGTVLLEARAALGDTATGQRPEAGTGAIATGDPVPGSPYLGDGVLTRAELEDAVKSTADRDESIDFRALPTSVPGNVLLEGYGIVEPESGQRAVEVLMGERPRPERDVEDTFFLAESSLRRAIYGEWNRGGEIAPGDGAPAAADDATNPFAGLTPADVPDLATSLRLIEEVTGPFPSPGLAGAAAAQAGGPTVTYWLHHRGGCVDNADPGPFMDTVNSTGDDHGCGAAGTGGVFNATVQSWPATEPSAVTIPAGSEVNGTIWISTWTPAPVRVTATLLGEGRLIGRATTETVLVAGTPLSLASTFVDIPFTFGTLDDVAVGETLTLTVALETTATWFFGYEEPHASSFTITLPDQGEGGGSGELAATITSPAGGTVVDPAETPTVAVTGTATFPAGTVDGTERLFLRRAGCGTDADGLRLTLEDGPDGGSGCGFIPGVSVFGKVIDLSDRFPAEESALPLTLGDGSVSALLHYEAEVPSPVARIRVELSTIAAGVTQVIGTQTVQKAVVGWPVEQSIPFAFSFPIPESWVGRTVDNLTLTVLQEEAQGGMFLELDNPPAWVDLPVQHDSGDAGGAVQVSVGDPSFSAPVEASLGTDGTWGATIDATVLPDGAHTIYARAVQGDDASVADSVTIVVERSGAPPPTPSAAVVQLQLVAADGAPDPGRWFNAVDATGDGTFSAWTAQVHIAGLPNGIYHLHARLLVQGEQVAMAAPVQVRKAGR